MMPTKTPGVSVQFADGIAVIESLDANQGLRTGTILKEEVLEKMATADSSTIQATVHSPKSRDELFGVLSEIARQLTQRHGRPILHFDIHGVEDGSGLEMSNGDQLAWHELTPYLLDINEASRNSTVLVLAVCRGTGLQRIMPKRRAPYWGIVAPNGEVKAGRLYKGMRAFYEHLLTTGDGNGAVDALNAAGAEDDPAIRYEWRSAEGLFRDYFKATLQRKLKGKPGKRTVEDRLTAAMKRDEGQRAGLSWTRKAVKAAIQTAPQKAFTRTRNEYLYLDKFPEEASRFSLTYEDCLPPEN